MSSLLSSQYLECAKKRLHDGASRNEADLRRATSDLYFCLFHRVSEALVETLNPEPDVIAEKEAWRRIYRLPEHKHVEKQCRDSRIKDFPDGIRSFANQLINFKTKREDADYDPLARFDISEVRTDIEIVASALARFDSCEQQRRTLFALFVTLRPIR